MSLSYAVTLPLDRATSSNQEMGESDKPHAGMMGVTSPPRPSYGQARATELLTLQREFQALITRDSPTTCHTPRAVRIGASNRGLQQRASLASSA